MFLKRKINNKLNLLLDLFGLCYENGNSAFVQNFNEEINTQMRKILMDTDIRFRVKEEGTTFFRVLPLAFPKSFPYCLKLFW